MRDHESGDCMCADGFEMDDKDDSCVDVNECADEPCRDNEVFFIFVLFLGDKI